MSVEFVHGDCLEVMGKFAQDSFDLVFSDSPFNLNLKYDGYRDSLGLDDYYGWCEKWINDGVRLLKPTGTFYLMTVPKHAWQMETFLRYEGCVFINKVIWRNVSANHVRRTFWNSYQPILVFGKTENYKFNPMAQTRKIEPQNLRWGGYTTEPKGQLLDYWDDIKFVYAGSIAHPEAILEPGTNSKVHPAQMPIALGERIILFSTDPGDRVMDIFAGLGSLGIAAYRTGRDYVGIEQSSRYVQLCQQRLQNEINNPTLFEEPGSSNEKMEQIGLDQNNS